MYMSCCSLLLKNHLNAPEIVPINYKNRLEKPHFSNSQKNASIRHLDLTFLCQDGQRISLFKKVENFPRLYRRQLDDLWF